MEIIKQGSPQWFDLKRGKISASHMSDILMKPSTTGYRNYSIQLMLERLLGVTEETYQSFDMKRGIDLEPLARECYQFETGVEVSQIAWVDHPTIPMSGCSPDGLIFVDGRVLGGIEIKCPKAATHYETWVTEKIDTKYLNQMHWQMACSPTMEWNDFVSYHPAFPDEKQLKIIRVMRDETKISELETAVRLFDQAVNLILEEFGSR